MNRFSSSTRGTPVVGEGNGEGRDSDQSAAQLSDPAPADLDENYRKQLLAYEAGKRAKSDGNRAALIEVLAWLNGWDGEPLED